MKISPLGVELKPSKTNFKNQKVTTTLMTNSSVNSFSYQNLSFLGNFRNEFHSIPLLKQTTFLNKGNIDYTNAIMSIESTGFKKLTQQEEQKTQGKTPIVWIISPEFNKVEDEKQYGQIINKIQNEAQENDIDIPIFTPMYLKEGTSSLITSPNDATYFFNGKKMPLQKIATIKTDIYDKGHPKTLPITYYLHEERIEGEVKSKQIFVHVDDYFDGDIYSSSAKADETQKSAIFSKAVYEFAKLRIDGTKPFKEAQIHSYSALDKINPPNTLILNGWQTSPVAPLIRYSAQAQSASKEISSKTGEQLEDIEIISIAQDLENQGTVSEKTQMADVLNTLFGKYAYDIVSHAKTKASETNPEDKGLKNLDNVLIMDYEDNSKNSLNLLNMSLILSDYFVLKGKGEDGSLISSSQKEDAKALLWALEKKEEAGKVLNIYEDNSGKIKVKTKE